MVRRHPTTRLHFASKSSNVSRFELRKRQTWDGFSAELIRFSRPTEFAFCLEGDASHLALCNFVRTDGETTLGSEIRSVQKDLRGKLTFVPASCPFQGWSTFGSRASSMVMAFFDFSADETGELKGRDLRPALHFDDTQLQTTLLKIHGVLDGSANDDRIYVETLGTLLYLELRHLRLSRDATEIDASGGLTPLQLKRLKDYIEGNLDRDISLAELARLAKLSRFHFVRAFKKTTGIPPYQFVLLRRINRAQGLLATSELPLSAIAATTGFRGVAQFSRAFRQFMNVSPTKFRRLSNW